MEVKYLIAFNICVLSHTQVTRVTGAVEKLKEEHFVSKMNVGKNVTIFKQTNSLSNGIDRSLNDLRFL